MATIKGPKHQVLSQEGILKNFIVGLKDDEGLCQVEEGKDKVILDYFQSSFMGST